MLYNLVVVRMEPASHLLLQCVCIFMILKKIYDHVVSVTVKKLLLFIGERARHYHG